MNDAIRELVEAAEVADAALEHIRGCHELSPAGPDYQPQCDCPKRGLRRALAAVKAQMETAAVELKVDARPSQPAAVSESNVECEEADALKRKHDAAVGLAKAVTSSNLPICPGDLSWWLGLKNPDWDHIVELARNFLGETEEPKVSGPAAAQRPPVKYGEGYAGGYGILEAVKWGESWRDYALALEAQLGKGKEE